MILYIFSYKTGEVRAIKPEYSTFPDGQPHVKLDLREGDTYCSVCCSKNSKGFIELDSHIGLIYGDSITIERAEKICKGLYDKGFSVTNLVYGVGSFTYQLVTRDTDGWAMKATAAIVDNQLIEIYKNPKTDDGLKKSAKGFIAVYKNDKGKYFQKDSVSLDDTCNCEYKSVFKNGELLIDSSLAEIREIAKKSIDK